MSPTAAVACNLFWSGRLKMAEIAVAGALVVLKFASGLLGNLAIQEGTRMFKLKDDMEWIEREMGYIQIYLKRADNIVELQEDTVEAALVKDIRDLAYDVEDIVEIFFPQIEPKKRKGRLGWLKRATTSILSRGYVARSFIMEIEGIKRRVQEIPRIRQTYGAIESNAITGDDIWERRKHFLYHDEPIIVGFEKEIELLVEKLLDGVVEHPVVSIVGMPGLGKTTLAKKVLKAVEDQFDCSAMVYVSKSPNIERLLQDIAKQVGLEKQEYEENVRTNLHSYLAYERYVILLDDIWDPQSWDDIKACIPNNCQSGSRIILTSRNREVGVRVGGVRSLHELQPLNEDDSHNLFHELVTKPLEITNKSTYFHELELLGRRIVEKCGGVPLAIEVVSGLLRGKETTERDWKRVLDSMGHDNDMCSKVLALSYRDLPVELKPCFLYFAVLPEDYEVSAFDMINLWTAEGFVQPKRGLQPEDVGEDYLKHLVAKNMIQVSSRRLNGSIRTCRIHDLMHSFCIRVALENNFFNTQDDIISPTTRVRRVAISNDSLWEYISSCSQTAKIRAVVCSHEGDSVMDSAKQVVEFFKGSRCLRVLRVGSHQLPSILVEEIGSLGHLKYIGTGPGDYILGGSHPLKLPSTIGNLNSLMTLDLTSIYIEEFPNEIWKAKQLRHILFNETCGSVKNSSSKIEVCLPNLQTLYLAPGQFLQPYFLRTFTTLRKLGISDPTNSMIEVLSDANPVSDKLEILKLGWIHLAEKMTMNFSQYQNLCRLNLKIRGITMLPKLPPNLMKLTIVLAGVLVEDPLETLKSLSKLKIVKMEISHYYRGEMACHGGPEAFPELELLELEILTPLELVLVADQAMPKIKKLNYIPSLVERLSVPERIRDILVEF